MSLKVLAAESNIGMTYSEAHDFLGRGQLLVQLGTVDENGDPNIHTTWYVYDSGTGKLYLATGKNSKKAQNLKRKNKVYFCVDDDKPPQKGVRGKATARIIEEKKRNMEIAEKIAIKYLGTTKGQFASWFIDHVTSGVDIVVELSPLYLSTWDYAKMKI